MLLLLVLLRRTQPWQRATGSWGAQALEAAEAAMREAQATVGHRFGLTAMTLPPWH